MVPGELGSRGVAGIAELTMHRRHDADDRRIVE
jgi:hypothetical protein